MNVSIEGKSHGLAGLCDTVEVPIVVGSLSEKSEAASGEGLTCCIGEPDA